MDFMKVFDQTVREIKREVNLKVLKVPEIEQKVLDATDDAPWGPHGTTLAEIAQATKKFTECQMIMNVLWTRLGETAKDWRLVYKALTVIEYLVANGSERALDDIIEHTFQISSLTSFEYVEPSGKDAGLNVRKKAENITALLNDNDKIQQTRNKAAANRDKYVGVSSSGITNKSGSASFSSSGFQSSSRYDSYKDSYRDGDHYGEEKDTYRKSRRGATGDDAGNNLKNSSSRFSSKDQKRLSASASKSSNIHNPTQNKSVPFQNASASSSNFDADFDDDFDPRGTSSSKAATGSTNQVDLFGESSIGDLMDAPPSVSSGPSAGNGNSSEADLFADAAFVSAPPPVDKGATPNPQASPFLSNRANVDLFASGPAIPPAVPAPVDFFSTVDVDPVVQPDAKAQPSDPMNNNIVDPFMAMPLNNFDGSDLFGAFSSSSTPATAEPVQSAANDGSLKNMNMNASDSKPQAKDALKVKSGIWADSITRGLIDLNISAPKKVSLADVGVVGDLGVQDEKKGPPASLYMGRAMGTGSSLGRPGFTSSQSSALDDDFFSSLSSQKY